MAEQLPLALGGRRRVPPCIARDIRHRHRAVMSRLAAKYGVKHLDLVMAGRFVELRGPRGGLHAQAGRPAKPLPSPDDPMRFAWFTQAAEWADRARGCRGCGKALAKSRLNRFGRCRSCAKVAKDDAFERQAAFSFGKPPKGYTSPLKGARKRSRGRAA